MAATKSPFVFVDLTLIFIILYLYIISKMKKYFLKPGTFLKTDIGTKDIPGLNLENYIVNVINNPTCCPKISTSFLAKTETILSLGDTADLSLDGNQLLIPSGTNRLWSCKITSSSFVKTAGGTLVVGDSYMVETNLLVKKVAGVTSIVGLNGGNSIYDTNMQTAFFSYSIGPSQNLVITFNAPTTASSTTFKCASKIELSEISL